MQSQTDHLENKYYTMNLKFTTFIFLSFFCFNSYAESWQLGFHNDAVANNDGNYSNALFLNYTDQVGGIIGSNFVFAHSLHIGQKIWTPSDIKISTPQKNERPYAGLSFAEISGFAFTEDTSYRASAMLGVVGEQSKARSLQTEMHRFLDVNKPLGWDNQIENATVFQFTVETDLLLSRVNTLVGESDLSLFGRLSAGNYQSDAAIGYTFRWGGDLGANFNNLNLHPYRMNGILLTSDGPGIIFYVTTEAFYRFNDITIEGDKPDTVPDVTLKNIQGSIASGIFYYYNNFGVNLSAIVSTPSFKEDKEDQYLISALSFLWRF